MKKFDIFLADLVWRKQLIKKGEEKWQCG